MPYKIALMIAIVFQVTSVVMAMRLHWKYRSHSAWIMISTAALLVAILELATLMLIWRIEGQVISSLPLWTACLSAVTISVLFLGGFTLIEPLFVELAKAEKLLRKEKQLLENTVQATEDELRLARQIQQNLLPSHSPNLENFDIAGASKPAVWTSGDYFDYIATEEGAIVVVADVSGHGTGPALLMVETRAFLRILSEGGSGVGDILTQTNHAIAPDIETNQFVTAFVVEISAASRQIVCAAAGHDALLIYTNGEHRVLSADKPPLGIDAELQFDSSPPQVLAQGDILLLMTDGIPEAVSSGGAQFGVERVIELIDTNRASSAETIVAKLFDEVSEFIGDSPQRDDVTAVVIKSV